jgi:hypothetical protein
MFHPTEDEDRTNKGRRESGCGSIASGPLRGKSNKQVIRYSKTADRNRQIKISRRQSETGNQSRRTKAEKEAEI